MTSFKYGPRVIDLASLNTNAAVRAPTRQNGYVNWNSTHDIIKTQNWKLVSKFTSYCGQGEIGNINGMYHYREPIDDHVNQNKIIVDEENRFPQYSCVSI